MDLVGRDAQIAELRAITSTGRSAVVVGAAGSGRTSLLQVSVSGWVQAGRPVWFVLGGDGAAGVPLAAFAPLIKAHDLTGAEPLAIYSSLPARVRDSGAMVVVDDVGQLDRASAVLLSQMARAGVVCVVAAVDRSELVGSIRDAGLTSAWTVVGLSPLDVDDVLAVAIVAAAGLSDSPAGAVFERIVVDDEVRRLAKLPERAATPDQNDVIEWLAVAGTLPMEVLATSAVEELERSDTVVLVDTSVRLRDELFDDIVLVRLGSQGVVRRRREVVDLLGDLPDWRGLRTLLSIRSGLDVEVESVRRAVRLALADDRLAEARELLDAMPELSEAADLVMLGGDERPGASSRWPGTRPPVRSQEVGPRHGGPAG